MNLADIYSYIDSKKRAVGGLLADPGGTVDKYVSQFREDNKARLNLMDNAYPMAGDRTVLNSPHQLDQFRKQLADEGANMATAGTYFVAPNRVNKQHLEAVKKEMEIKGAPTLRAYWDGEKYIGLEGSHRAQAAKELGITPEIEDIGLKQWMVDHDFPDVKQKASSNRLLDYLDYGNHPNAQYIDFEDL